MVNNASRFEVDAGRIECEGVVVCRVGNNPLIPNEMWDDDRLSFKEGLEPVSSDPSSVPEDLQDKLKRHGYWAEHS